MEDFEKSFIEDTFPVKEVSEESAREKNIRHGHISTLHIWWTRKPLASSRATSFSAFIPAEKDPVKKERLRQFIIELSKWENSLNREIIKDARELILKSNGGKPPRILDPFSGGGSIPLEALRLGCEVHSVEYNPVAVLILKCTLEYPQKYGKSKKRRIKDNLIEREEEYNPLLEDVKYWGNWVLERVREEIGRFYPQDSDGSIPVGYYWMRTIPCQNPICGASIPLTANWWLAKKDNRKISLMPIADRKNKRVDFVIVEEHRGSWRIIDSSITDSNPLISDFDPEEGTVSRAIVTCPVCGSTISDDTTRRLFQEGKAGQRMVAVVLNQGSGKRYRLATEKDMEVFKEAEKYLEKKRAELMEKWGIDPVPDEELPPKETLGFRVQRYGMLKWGDLFNSRQKLALITFTEKVREAYENIRKQVIDEEYAKAVVAYLGISINNIVEKNNSISRWANTKETIAGSFSRQAMPMIWDYFESNAFSGSTGDWSNSIEYNLKVLSHLSQIPPVEIEEEG